MRYLVQCIIPEKTLNEVYARVVAVAALKEAYSQKVFHFDPNRQKNCQITILDIYSFYGLCSEYSLVLRNIFSEI